MRWSYTATDSDTEEFLLSARYVDQIVSLSSVRELYNGEPIEDIVCRITDGIRSGDYQDVFDHAFIEKEGVIILKSMYVEWVTWRPWMRLVHSLSDVDDFWWLVDWWWRERWWVFSNYTEASFNAVSNIVDRAIALRDWFGYRRDSRAGRICKINELHRELVYQMRSQGVIDSSTPRFKEFISLLEKHSPQGQENDPYRSAPAAKGFALEYQKKRIRHGSTEIKGDEWCRDKIIEIDVI